MKRPTGKLYTSNPSGLKHLNHEAEIWQITRGRLLFDDALLVRGLAPSEELFNHFINNWKDLPPEQWWQEYERQFLLELKSDEKLSNLRTLYKTLQFGKNVILVCFCKDVLYCHRRLVGEFFMQHGVEAVELSSSELEPEAEASTPKQLTIYDGVM
ncbi:MAG: DUF488 family protein [Bacillota bacterium]|nr:DUF488 family protein [Bacillota bacterium]MDW7684772.1 DUF488 family protein [Bacillota bacterium]